MLAYTPKFHSRLERVMSRAVADAPALGGLSADLKSLEEASGLIRDELRSVKEGVDGIPSDLPQMIIDKVDSSLERTADVIVRRIQQLPAAPKPAVDAAVLPVLRILIQAQGVAMDATPGELVGGRGKQTKDNAAIRALRESKAITDADAVLSNDVLGRVLAALRDFDSVARSYRSLRWWEMHYLCADIAALINPESGAPGTD